LSGAWTLVERTALTGEEGTVASPCSSDPRSATGVVPRASGSLTSRPAEPERVPADSASSWRWSGRVGLAATRHRRARRSALPSGKLL